MGNICTTLCNSKENQEDSPKTEIKRTSKQATKGQSKSKQDKKSKNTKEKGNPTSQSGGHKDKGLYQDFNQNTPTGESQSQSRDQI